MTQHGFESLVKRLEQEAQANPTAYRRRLGALALLGYGYVAGALMLLLAGAVLIIWMATISPVVLLLFGWTLLVLIYVIVRAMWVTLEPPQGRLLQPAECPHLFQLIEAVRAKMEAPGVDRLLLTGDFNAAIVQHPRFGILGGTRNDLLIGLPLLQCLSTREFAAVLAHEFGHLSGAHGHFGAWIYRLRTGWGRLLDAVQAQQHWGAALFTRFFNWYAPLFSAYSFVQARQQEYEADQMSVAAVGAGPTASALLRVNTEGEFIGEAFWPAIFKRADEEPVPTVAPFSMLASALREQNPPSLREIRLARCLAVKTGYEDTHPCLADRLEALGMRAYVPQPIQASAADALLGGAAERLRRELDESWRVSVKQWWSKRYQYVTESRGRNQ